MEYGNSDAHDELTFNGYAAATDTTAIYPNAGFGGTDAINYCILGLAGEAGEIPNKWKKVFRDNGGVITPEVRRAMLDELGDVLWYAARLADELDTNLGTVAAKNIQKLISRRDRDVLGGSGDDR